MIQKETIEKVQAWREDRNRSKSGWTTTEGQSAAVKLLDEMDIIRGNLEAADRKAAALAVRVEKRDKALISIKENVFILKGSHNFCTIEKKYLQLVDKALSITDSDEEVLKNHNAKVEEKERLRWADAFARLVTFFSPGHPLIQGLNQAICDLRVGPLPKDGLIATKTEAGS